MLFPRPVSCELEYINEKRLCNVLLIEEMYKKHSTLEIAKTKKDSIENPCVFTPPFWWETDDIKTTNKLVNYEHRIQNQNKQSMSKRWRPIPDPIGQRNKTKCQRKEELSLYILVDISFGIYVMFAPFYL